MSDKPPAYATFHVTNPFQLLLDMHNAGCTDADIHFVIDTLEWREPMQRAVAAYEQGDRKGGAKNGL